MGKGNVVKALNAKTRTVHASYVLAGNDLAAQCGADAWKNGAPVFTRTDKDVSCKRCIKIVDKREADRRAMAIAPELLARAMPAAHEAIASEDHPAQSDMITEAVPEIELPIIAGHRWQRHTLPGEAVTEYSTYQAVVETSHCLVSGYVSYQARTGTWTATGRRNGMSAMVSANSWGGVTLPEALAALAANVAENEAAANVRSGPLATGTADLYPSPMEASDYDRMNADMERADIHSEETAEVAFEAMLAEIFPGDDDPYGTYAECGDQLPAEREACQACRGWDDAIHPCAVHRTVEAWLRAERAIDAREADVMLARVESVLTQWKATTSKHKRAHKRR